MYKRKRASRTCAQEVIVQGQAKSTEVKGKRPAALHLHQERGRGTQAKKPDLAERQRPAESQSKPPHRPTLTSATHQSCCETRRGSKRPASPKQDALFLSKRKKGPCGEAEHPIEGGNRSALRQALLKAVEEFEQSRTERRVWNEVDVATLMAPYQAVGREVRVYWPDEDAWFLGSVTSFDPVTARHEVCYADDDRESLWLAWPLERVRMMLAPGESFEPPPSAALSHLCSQLLKEANDLGSRGKRADSGSSAKLEALKSSCQRLQSWLTSKRQGSGLERGLLNPGEVVWAKGKGWPYWPAVVSTPLDAAEHHVKGALDGGLCVQFFGEATWSCVKLGSTLPLTKGVELGLFHKVKRPAFKKAIEDTIAYLQEGCLPENMQPANNDSGFSSDDEDDIATQGPLAPRMREKDWAISSKLTVHCLGRIEFLHPAYHDMQHIWPLGYRSTSLAFSPAARSSPALHTCEIAASPDGAGPLFRITCGEVMAESKEGPQAAWQKLGQVEPRHKGRQEGLQLFGFKSAKVLQSIQKLPNAHRLESYCWPSGRLAEVPKMTVSESRARLKATVEMQQLPEGVRPVAVALLEGPRCEACGGDEESEDNVLLQCDGPCRAFVHQECCGVLDRPYGAWVCDLCKTGCTNPPACALCPVRGGCLLRTTCGRWCHAMCALWVPEAFIDTQRAAGAAVDISGIAKARRQLACSVCKQSYGACIQCGASKACFTAFHPLCARASRLSMECVHDEHFAADSGDVKPPTGPVAVDVMASSSGGIAMVPPRRRKTVLQGTAVGDGTRLVWLRHTRSFPRLSNRADHVPSCLMGRKQSRRQGINDFLAKGQNLSFKRICLLQVCYCCKHRPNTTGRISSAVSKLVTMVEARVSLATTAAACPQQNLSSRCSPFDHALRRGHRAPEAAAAALAKRHFLLAEAYKVTELPLRGKRALFSNCLTSDSLDPRFRAGKMSKRLSSSGGAPGKLRVSKKVVPSVSERYWQMRATESQRVAFGKSLIHGWGALSKVGHAKGDMVIEYSGELIRPSVADVRERQMYDSLVGAGTYIFRMNEELCVDATRAGNLAHMLNHSCQPNCFSRTIQVTARKSAVLEEHVVIFAQEDIAAGQELTYDYRFSSSEKLPCNCGAPNCSGLVNESGAARNDIIMIPRAQLQPLL